MNEVSTMTVEQALTLLSCSTRYLSYQTCIGMELDGQFTELLATDRKLHLLIDEAIGLLAKAINIPKPVIVEEVIEEDYEQE